VKYNRDNEYCARPIYSLLGPEHADVKVDVIILLTVRQFAACNDDDTEAPGSHGDYSKTLYNITLSMVCTRLYGNPVVF